MINGVIDIEVTSTRSNLCRAFSTPHSSWSPPQGSPPLCGPCDRAQSCRRQPHIARRNSGLGRSENYHRNIAYKQRKSLRSRFVQREREYLIAPKRQTHSLLVVFVVGCSSPAGRYGFRELANSISASLPTPSDMLREIDHDSIRFWASKDGPSLLIPMYKPT